MTSQITSPTRGTDAYLGTWNSSSAAAMPANSAIVVTVLATSSSSIASVVPRTPNRSRIRSARPLPVTTAIRASISLTTARLTVIRARIHSIRKPNSAPAWEYVAMAPASLPALVVIRPGPSTASRMNRRRKRRRRSANRVTGGPASVRGPGQLALHRLGEDGVEHVVHGDQALDSELVVHHRDGEQVVLAEDGGDLLGAVVHTDGDHVADHQRADRRVGLGDDQVA